MTLSFILLIIVAYVIGGIPSGPLVVDRRGVDLTTRGSGKTGMTNVMRTAGYGPAALVAVGDILKGVLAIFAARWIIYNVGQFEPTINLGSLQIATVPLVEFIAATVVIAGHVWSVWLRLFTGKWSGGRGVLTGAGAVLVVMPVAALVATLIAVPLVLISRYVSLGSITGAAIIGLVILIAVLLQQANWLYLFFIILPIFVIAAHKDNIDRLLKGTERRLGEKA